MFLHVSVILFTDGVPGQVPLWAGTPPPPGQVCPLPKVGTPQGRYSGQVHPKSRYTPSHLGRYIPFLRQVPSKNRYPLGRYTPKNRYTPAPPGIWSTSGRYASYWNAFLLTHLFMALKIFHGVFPMSQVRDFEIIIQFVLYHRPTMQSS